MNLKSLQIFRQIVLTGSLSEAAARLHVSAPAASRLLSLLEAELELKLFSRRRRRLTLTEEGDLFYRSVANTLDGLEALGSVSADIRARTRNWLSVVTAAPMAQALVSPALSRMRQADPGLQCVLNVETRFDIESKVAARGYNLGLISLPVENEILNLSVEPFLKARVEVMLPRDHLLAARATLSIADVADEPFAALRPRQRWRDRLDEIFGETGRQAKVPIETSSTVLTMQMVRDGLGLALIDRATAAMVADDRAVLRPLQEERWITYASLHPEGPRSPLSDAFLDAVSAHVEVLRAESPEAAASLELI